MSGAPLAMEPYIAARRAAEVAFGWDPGDDDLNEFLTQLHNLGYTIAPRDDPPVSILTPESDGVRFPMALR